MFMRYAAPSETDRPCTNDVVKSRWLIVATCTLIVLPGCGAIVETAVENAVEEAAGVEFEEGQDGSFSIEGEDISIQLDTDADGGTLSIDSADGSIEVDASEDGTVNVTTEDFEGEDDQELTITPMPRYRTVSHCRIPTVASSKPVRHGTPATAGS